MKTPANNQSKSVSLLAAVLCLISLSYSSEIFADTMPIPVAEQGNQSLTNAVPHNGQKMPDVEQQYGAPVEKIAPVGEPPITRWIYPDFTVYFENDTVLHSVIRKS